MIEENGAWHCDKCNRNYPEASQRFILSLMVCDPTGSTWLTAFDDSAKALLGNTAAKDLADMVKSDMKEQASAKFKEHNFKVHTQSTHSKKATTADSGADAVAHTRVCLCVCVGVSVQDPRQG